MINSHAPLLGLAVRPPCLCLRWPFIGVTALHAERPGTPSDVSARNESCTPVWWVGRDHSSSSVSLRPRMAVSFGFEVVPYGLSGEWRHGDNGADRARHRACAITRKPCSQHVNRIKPVQGMLPINAPNKHSGMTSHMTCAPVTGDATLSLNVRAGTD